MPVGGEKAHSYNNFEEECSKRRGIVCINNKDSLCLLRSLLVAIAFIDKDPEYVKVRKEIGKIQYQRALQLSKNAGVVIPEEGAGIAELQLFQRYLSSYGTKGRNVIFRGNSDGLSINLLYHEGHYNVITSLTSAFCCTYYYEECHIPYNTKGNRRCGGTCAACRQTPSCSSEEVKVNCDNCKRSFRGMKCFENHKNFKICEIIHRCKKCFKVVPSGRSHTCGEIFCKICYEHCPSGHLCYMQPDTRSPTNKGLLFIFYDLETRQEMVLPDGSLLHEPSLCVFQQRCEDCLELNVQICKKCGLRQQVIKSKDVISPFVHHILSIRKKFKNIVVMAHNGGAFDHIFILNHILTKTDLKPEPIMRGTKLISMTIGNVKFLDSLNYFPMALSKLPKSFGLTELKKGYFPHLFNKIENQNYVGPIPSLEYYDPDNMKPEDRENFLSWYKTKVNEVFDFQKEITEYCISDVDILTRACLTFRKLMIDETNVCPFSEANTIASACNKVYRRNFLKSHTIGIIPKGGYRCRDTQSKIALQWLVWEENQRGIAIHHSLKGRESQVAGVKVDGYSSDRNLVFEFHGCYYHGCLVCFQYQRDDPLHEDKSQTLNLKYDATMAKTERLRQLGYEVVEMWECEFRKMISTSEEIKTFTENHPLLQQLPLEPRDALYGGRTGNTVTYYKAKEGEKIKYTDVCSLYPWVCKYGKFPIGHPEVFVGEACPKDLSSISGLVKCKILPPQDLFHPVLPVKMNKKLMFVLCRTCGEQYNSSECSHSSDERALNGVWVVEEIVKALEMGYKIRETYEVWSYKPVQCDKNVAGLFSGMMNKFIKIKQESSGWPSNCKTEEEKERYIEEFLQREDVRLEYSKIVNNPGLRSLAKLMLNSFWGKFGQRENQPQTSIVNKPAEFFSMMTNPAINVNTILPVNENTLVVNWEYKNEASDSLSTVNVVIAAYVTALARLKLYTYLEKLGNRAIYYDSDSVIYISRSGEYNIPTGSFLGNMTNELEIYGVGSYIVEFVSGGPKNYAYKVWSTASHSFITVCKVKGITLNCKPSELVNFESIKQMDLHREEPISILGKQIRRTKDQEVITLMSEKRYQPNSLKRKFFEDYTSLPYGYKKFAHKALKNSRFQDYC